ncbi:MAG: S4 domain-containing protein, partial [Planctomycetaceae bacterium]
KWQTEIAEGQGPAETDIPIVTVNESRLENGKSWIVKLLSKELGLASSGADARRLIKQGGVWINSRDNRVGSIDEDIPIVDGMLVGIGKKRVVRVRLDSS